MWFFWVFALLPVLFGVACFFFNRKIAWQEVLGTVVVAFLMAAIFQEASIAGLTADKETWSGYGTQARDYSTWQEYYEYAVYRTETYECGTDSKGNPEYCTRQVFDHWASTTRWHGEYWKLFATLGSENTDFNIDQSKFNYMCQKYNDRHAVAGDRVTGEHNSRMIAGDPNDYVADNKTGWIEPVTVEKYFKNKIKAAPTVFSYVKVSTNIAVFDWPSNPNWNVSDRVMGTAQTMINTLKWDQMNAVLGSAKKVNLIVIGFPSGVSQDRAKWQEAKFIGGKKNDLVIVYAGGNKTTHADWCSVFGWTEKNSVKSGLRDMFMDNPINDDIIPKISNEVKSHYTIKDWHKFDYITVEPPTWSYWVYLLTMLLVQGGLYIWFNVNELNNEDFDKKANPHIFDPIYYFFFKKKEVSAPTVLQDEQPQPYYYTQPADKIIQPKRRNTRYPRY